MAVQEQENDMKETLKMREKNPEKKRSMDTRCRVCHRQEESTFHLVCSCPVLASTNTLSTFTPKPSSKSDLPRDCRK